MSSFPPPASSLQPRRILVIRLDRLGDVILSTPVLQALREHYPHAFIAMMVRTACEDVVRGNPYLDEVVLYDKEGQHHGIMATFRFALGLRRQKFDTALVLHPTRRSHWITFLARIPNRIGYHRKAAFLLTQAIPHRKQEGSRHEAAYTLEMLKVFGIQPGKIRAFMPVRDDAIQRVNRLLVEASVNSGDSLVAIHPSASCISKRWMPERFAAVADRLSADCGVRICVVAGEADRVYAGHMTAAMKQPVIDLAGRLSVAELAAFLKRCRLLISNDSGPVHVAAAVGIPVVDIFGRNQSGLSPQRWGPLGEGHIVLHKEVGCVTCLAHRCDINFLCLTTLSADEVYQAARGIISRFS